MTEEEKKQARDQALWFGWLSIAILVAMGDSLALQIFFSQLRHDHLVSDAFDSVQEQARETLQTDFERIVEELARIAQINIPDWERQMANAIEGYLIAQATAARGRALLPSELLEIERDQIATQMDYLAGFRQDLESEPRTEDYISSRSKLYAGAGRALWYRIAEMDAPDGWVVDYHSVDDSGTCSPCVSAESDGPYLFGHGPFPGEVCLGRGRCRCQRQPRFDLAAWEALSAERLDFAA